MASRGVTLYRSILRAHKKFLPAEMKALGDTYVKAEFKAHKNAKPEHVTAFFQEWDNYLQQITVTARAKDSLAAGGGMDDGGVGEVFAYGSDLPPDVDLSEQQLEQLRKLREETSKFRKS
eukprot:scaffold3339_cov174-Amphora_coffeaeformis.AAC.4